MIEVLVFLTGLWLVFLTLMSAIRTFIMPRGHNVLLTRLVFRMMGQLINNIANRYNSYYDRDRILAYFSPVTLLALQVVWLIIVLLGYTLMFWATGAKSWFQAFTLSGSSLLTLGFAISQTFPQMILALSEAIIGLILVALLIAYLPTMYSAFSRRESFITKLEVRAGVPPSPVEMIARLYRIGRIDELERLWVQWEDWFTELEETHTSLPALNFFRSPHPDRSWVSAAEVILDGTALFISAVDLPATGQADICIRAGYIALRRIADFFRIAYNPHPKADDPVSISREQFEAACEELAKYHVPLKIDRDQAWRNFAGWRVNYDLVLLRLTVLMSAPPTQWVPQS